MMAYIIYAILVIIVFLLNLNGFLRGAKKLQIDVVLRSIITDVPAVNQCNYLKRYSFAVKMLNYGTHQV